MAKETQKKSTQKQVESFRHEEASRRNIPTAEYQSVMRQDEKAPVSLSYERGSAGLEKEKERRNRDLDPQLVWRGKDEKDWSELVVQAPPLYIQEKVHPKVLIDDLIRRTDRRKEADAEQMDLFADFNGLPDEGAKTEFYQHDANWSNRMILGDSLQVMASMAEREGLRGKVQCIYIDPPYGIRFNSNFQWSTTSRDVKDGNVDHITREPEQVKAFRDTWRDGIHSYLTYLRDRLTVARDLLADTGSIFVQIGDENVHRVRALMDEVFGEDNYVTEIKIQKTGSSTGKHIQNIFDTILWFFKSHARGKSRDLKINLGMGDISSDITPWLCVDDVGYRKLTKAEMSSPFNRKGLTIFQPGPINSQHPSDTRSVPLLFEGEKFSPPKGRQWTYDPCAEMKRLGKANYLIKYGKTLRVRMYRSDDDYVSLSNLWTDTQLGGLSAERIYVVQTSEKVIKRCILISTDPGDLVLDPTCGSGTTAYVAEQWGRRWITIDTSRVALALARARIMGARYPYYLLADSRDGQIKEAEITRTAPSETSTHSNIRQGFVYERVPHITLKSIANNAEIDVIWEKYHEKLELLRMALNKALGRKWEEWEIPREAETPWNSDTQKLFYALRAEIDKEKKADQTRVTQYLKAINHNLRRSYTVATLPESPADPWPEDAARVHAQWWDLRIACQKEIDASIAAKADFEYLYDKPYEDKKKVRVAGPFTVESLSPHRVLTVGEDDELIDGVAEATAEYGEVRDFAGMILDNLKTSGVQQAHKEDKINFTSITPWPGEYVCAEGRYVEGEEESGAEKRAAIFIGPEFGTVSRIDLVEAAREAGDAGFDALIACAFNYDAHSSEFNKLGRIPVLKARMNADLHMADDLKNTGKGNLFVIFGEPDIDILDAENGQIQVRINGVDVFHPTTGEVRSDGAEGIACWFIDTDYNMESFFVRHAYFLGANDPYKALKTTLKAEINEEAWATLNSDTSRPFDKPESGRIAVKVINHLGDEVMKVFKV
ncbi:MAG: site-specific DNA-methyltransferase [Proteobacteria bacterium]|nr:site-specific DNA-methyltransferase [Pseudomonadota bacterium]